MGCGLLGSRSTGTGNVGISMHSSNDVARLEAIAIGGNENKFLIMAASLKEWVALGAYPND